MKVLVAYASRHGSTQEVAEAVAVVLRDGGAEVDLQPARAVSQPADEFGWECVVLGGSLYSGRWHRDARRFLKRYRSRLEQVPVAIFAMGPRKDDVESWRAARKQLDRALARYAWLTPSAVTIFGGADSPKRAARLGIRRDLRDWDRIRAWAERLQAGV